MNPFAFEGTDNPLSCFSALTKAVFLASVSVAAMKLGWPWLAILAASGILLHPICRIGLRETLAAAIFVFWLSAFSALLKGIAPGDGRLFAPETLADSGLYAVRLFTIFLYARLYYVSTKASELGDTLTALYRAASRSIRSRGKPSATRVGSSPLGDPGMIVALTLHFLPRVFDTYARTREAALMRGYAGALSPRNLARTLSSFVSASLGSAFKVSSAMEARGYSAERTLILRRPSWRDAALLMAAAMLLFASALR